MKRFLLPAFKLLVRAGLPETNGIRTHARPETVTAVRKSGLSGRRGEIALLLFGLALAALGAEFAARTMEGRAVAKEGYAPVRGKRSREPLNSIGYRDVDHARVKPQGVHRAVFLGDSFTYGVGVLLDDTYPKRTERALSSARGEPWESLVFAVPGIDSHKEEEILENEAFAYDPDLVVLGYVLNDAESLDAAERRRAAQWEEREAEKRNPPWWRHSAFLRVVADRMRATRENRARISNHLALYEEGAPGLQLVRRSIERMAERCKERGIPFVVVVFPLFANPLDSRYPFMAAHRKVADLCASAGVVALDLLPFYRDLDWRLLVVEGANDEHPSELAHRIAAQTLVMRLDSVLPPRRTAAGLKAATP